MADMLERIGKELGNIHTSRRKLIGRDRGPNKDANVSDMTDEQVDRDWKQLFRKADTHSFRLTV